MPGGGLQHLVETTHVKQSLKAAKRNARIVMRFQSAEINPFVRLFAWRINRLKIIMKREWTRAIKS
jgi:hypothetical protein